MTRAEAARNNKLAKERTPLDALENLVKSYDNKKSTKSFDFGVQLEIARTVIKLHRHAHLCRDILGLAAKYITLEQAMNWTHKEREAAITWGAREHARAAVEEPPFPKRLKSPKHVAALPDISDIYPPEKPGGPWATRLRFSDGTEEVLSKFPGD